MRGKRDFGQAILCVLTTLLVSCGGGGSGGGSAGGGGGGAQAPAAPSISYGATSFAVTVQSSITLTPRNTGGAVASWSVGSGLPAGLNFDSSTGVISGMTATARAPANFTVTATNAGGSDSVTLTVGSQAVLAVLGSLGASAVAISASNVLTEDGNGTQHWILWDYASGAIVAEGDACPVGQCLFGDVGAQENVGLAGSIAVVPFTAKAFQILSTATGLVLATVNFSSFFWWHVASDGSYVCSGDTTALTAWAPDGTVILSHKGNYSQASASCVAGAMRVAVGPAGTNVIETVALPGGADSISPAFAGTFNSWFLDGGGFLSSVGNSVWVYSPAATQLDFEALNTTSDLGAAGNWFWTFDGTALNIYKIGASASPTVTYTAASFPGDATLQASGETLALWDTGVHIIDLSGAAPVETDYVATIGGSFAAVSAAQWVVAGSEGGVLDGTTLATTPRYFGYGSVRSIAGSPTRLAIATGIGTTLIYDTATWNLVTTVPGFFSKIGLSADGTVLATLGPGPFGTFESIVQTISLPTGTVVHSWSYDPDTAPSAVDITLSSSGALLGQVLSGQGFQPPTRQVTAASGGPVLWSDSGNTEQICLSTDDTLIAVSATVNNLLGTNIYLNDALSSAAPGAAAGWLAGDNLLQNLGAADAGPGDAVYSSVGVKQTGPSLPPLQGPIQILSGGTIFDASTNAIYQVSTGAKIWPPEGLFYAPAGVAGATVSYVVGDRLMREPY